MAGLKIVALGETAVRGVESLTIRGAQYNWAHVGWAESMIRIGGVTFVAAAIVAAVTGDRSPRMACYGHHCVKFGPGGRRLYVAVTERLVDEINAANVGGIEHGYTFDQRARSAEIVDFAVALIDFLPAAALPATRGPGSADPRETPIAVSSLLARSGS